MKKLLPILLFAVLLFAACSSQTMTQEDKDQLISEVKQELQGDMATEMREQIKAELKDELRAEILAEQEAEKQKELEDLKAILGTFSGQLFTDSQTRQIKDFFDYNNMKDTLKERGFDVDYLYTQDYYQNFTELLAIMDSQNVPEEVQFLMILDDYFTWQRGGKALFEDFWISLHSEEFSRNN